MLLAFIVVVVVCITLGPHLIRLWRKKVTNSRLREWTPVEGHMVFAPSVRRDGMFGANRLVRVTYDYKVNELSYQGSCDMLATSESHAFRLAGLLQGESMSVLYDPRNPARSQATVTELNKVVASISPDTQRST